MGCGNSKCPICYPEVRAAPPTAPPPKVYPFDEQLCLTDYKGTPASYVPYRVSLETRETFAGITDADGRTQRMGTDEPWTISRVEFTPASAARAWVCCGARDHDIERERVVIQASGNSIGVTNDRDVGSSVKTIYVPEGGKRSLTRGEVEEALIVFGSGINYATTKVHHGGWWLFMGKQDPNTAVTPNGEMYFPDAIYKDDYSSATISPKWIALFMHEMVHVWQYQMGYAVKRHGLTVTRKGESAYIYRLTPDSQLRDFNMEQQGDLISDYYMICVRKDNFNALNPGKDPALLRKVMEPFLHNPRDKIHLPG